MKNKNKPLKVNLKSNSNISFDVKPEFCSCGRPMFLKKGRDGRVFWACKGFHNNPSKKVCDHTRDLKCFRCNRGEILLKTNSETKEKFYGCSDFSEVSESSCNLALQKEDMNDVIKQVNDGLKFRFNFRSITHNDSDQRIIDRINEVVSEETKKELKCDIDCCDNDDDDDDDRVENSWWYKLLALTLTPEKGADGKVKKGPLVTRRFAVYIVSVMFLIAMVAVVQGSGVEVNLFNGMFVLNVKPVAPTQENVNIEYDAEKGELVIENKSLKDDVDIGDLAILDNLGNKMIDFSSLPGSKKLLETNETIRLNENDLLAMMENNTTYFEDYQYDDDDVMSAPVEEDLEDEVADEEMRAYLTEQLASNNLNFVSEVIDNGKEVYNKLKTRVINRTEIIKDKYRSGYTETLRREDEDSNYLEVAEGDKLEGEDYTDSY